MNPQSQERNPSLELPKPQIEQITQGSEALPLGLVNEQQNSMAVERGVGMQSDGPQVSSLPPSTGIPQSPLQQPPATPITSVLPSTPAIADDADLIEKEWVEKAKEIVEKTRNDPYLQNQEINKVKADYLKKRYNKDVTLAE
jgi:hypothetical protein